MVSMSSNIYMMADWNGGDNENMLSRSPEKETVRR